MELLLLIVIFVLLAERIGKWIPDSKTGPLGVVRKAAKFIALYTENVK